MRLRTTLLGFILIALLLGFQGVAVTSAADYATSASSLRTLWVTDLAAGVSSSQLAPLQAELAATEANTLASLPTITFNPLNARSEIASLRLRTNAIYLNDLYTTRTSAINARAALGAALGPLTVVEAHMLREEMNAATTPADYTTLAAAWQLDAKLVPLDRSLTSHLTSLKALIGQAHSLDVSTPDATTLAFDITAYFTLSPTWRFAAANTLIARTGPVTTSLQTRINAEIATRAAAARAAATRAAANAAAAPYAPGCGYLIDVNLTTQSMVASHCGVVFITSLITSGRPGYRSPVGTFYTSTKYQHVWFSYYGLYTPQYVKYAIRFWGLYYLHTWDQPALSDFGPGSQNGPYASLGCIEMPDNVMAAIYNWAPAGTAVHIHY